MMVIFLYDVLNLLIRLGIVFILFEAAWIGTKWI